MKRVKSYSNLTDLVPVNNLPNDKKQDFIKYIEDQKQKKKIEEIKKNENYDSYYNQDTSPISFDQTTGISGFDPNNKKVNQYFKKEIVCIDSKYRNISKYPFSNDFKSFLGKTFKNVVKIKLVSSEIPNVEEVIRDTPIQIQNNLVSWQNEEDYDKGIINTSFVYDSVQELLLFDYPNHPYTQNETIKVNFSNCSVANLALSGNSNLNYYDSNTLSLQFRYDSDTSGTVDIDFGIPIYTIEITPGSYDSTTIANEIQTKMNLVKRSNGQFHYFNVTVNNKTDIFSFNNYDTQRLTVDPVSTTTGSTIITITKENHGFKAGDIVFINGISKVGGITANFLNGEFTVLNPEINSFQFETNSIATQTITGGGNNIIIGRSMKFRFLFDTENTLIQYNIGFPNEDSAEYINATNPITTNVVELDTIYSNVPEGFSTFVTKQPHLLNSSNILKITDITLNSNPVFITTDINHGITETTNIILRNISITPDISNTYISVTPVDLNRLVINVPDLFITDNDISVAIVQQEKDFVNIYNLVAEYSKTEYYTGLSIPVYSVIDPYTFTIDTTFNSIIESSFLNTKIGTSKLKIRHNNHLFYNFIELYTNEELPLFSGLSPNYKTVNGKTQDTLSSSSVSNKYKNNAIVVENDPVLSNSLRNIVAITSPSTGIVQIQLNSDYFYIKGEKIIVSGTNSLDGEYSIYLTLPTGPPPLAPYDLYSARFIQIQTTEIDLTFSGSPQVSSTFHSENTLRIMYLNHNFQTNQEIRILDSNNTLPLTNYYIKYLSDNSFLINYTHSILSTTEILALVNINGSIISSQTKITPELNEKNDYYNEVYIKDITGQIKLGDLTKIQNLTLPQTISWEDLATNKDGTKISIIGYEGYPRINNFPIVKYSNQKYLNVYYSSIDSGNTFQNNTKWNIQPLMTNDTVYITDGNAILSDNINYSIDKLSKYSFKITHPHSSLVPNTTIKFKLSSSENIEIEGMIVENDSTLYNSTRNVLDIQDISGFGIPANLKIVIVDSRYNYIKDEEITITGTNSLDGTYPIYTNIGSYNTFPYFLNTNKIYDSSQFIYIITPISDNSFSGTPTVSVGYNEADTLKIICPLKKETLNKIRMTEDGKDVYINAYEYTFSGTNYIYKVSNYNQNIEKISLPSNLLNIFLNLNSDGKYVVIGGFSGNDYYIYISNNYGVSFYLRKIFSVGNVSFQSFLNISDNGQYLLCGIGINGPPIATVRIFNSINYGISWSEYSFGNPYVISYTGYVGESAAISLDGKYQTICLTENFPTQFRPTIFVSNDYGISFNIKLIASTLPFGGLNNVAMDSTGRYQICANDSIYYSEDYGETWKSNFEDSNLWQWPFYSSSFGTTSTNPECNSIEMAKNGKIFYTIQNNNIGKEPFNTLYKWSTPEQQPLIIQTEPSKHYYTINDTITIKDNSDSFLNDTYTIIDIPSPDTLEILSNKLIVPVNYSFKGTLINRSRLNIITDNVLYTNSGISSLLLENDTALANSSRIIETIEKISDNITKITLTNWYYYNPEETITISGTNSLDGNYTIINVEYLSSNLSGSKVIYINSTEEDITFTGSPTISPLFHENDTLRIIYPLHSLPLNSDYTYTYVYITNILPAGYYKVNDVLSTNSFVIDYIHSSLQNTSNINVQSLSGILGILRRNNEILLYRIESRDIKGVKNFIGGIPVEYLTSNVLELSKIIDANNYIIDIKGIIANEQETGGGDSVYISSLQHGIRLKQLNTYDGTSSTKLFRSISLEGYNYIFLCSYGKETDLNVVYNNTGIQNVFAKILLNEPPGHMCFNSFLSIDKVFNNPIPELSELTFTMYTPEGYLYNFNDTDYSLALEITTLVEEIDNTYISSKNKNKLIDNEIYKID